MWIKAADEYYVISAKGPTMFIVSHNSDSTADENPQLVAEVSLVQNRREPECLASDSAVYEFQLV